ncbi:MAG: BlaI/MecI/CopY family transcriptional regulator [Sedimentisphaerales bacterium]|nr:BlaI/MecI/CopY family transcriptional regulator [Sedimentisphaerales bacterium]
MQVLWRIEKGFVRDILERFPEPRPKYSTVSTITRILESKGFVGHKAYGKSHQYLPLVSKEAYAKASLGSLVQDYFGNSFRNLVHCLSQREDLDIREVEEVIDMLEDLSKKRRDRK